VTPEEKKLRVDAAVTEVKKVANEDKNPSQYVKDFVTATQQSIAAKTAERKAAMEDYRTSVLDYAKANPLIPDPEAFAVRFDKNVKARLDRLTVTELKEATGRNREKTSALDAVKAAATGTQLTPDIAKLQKALEDAKKTGKFDEAKKDQEMINRDWQAVGDNLAKADLKKVDLKEVLKLSVGKDATGDQNVDISGDTLLKTPIGPSAPGKGTEPSR
jgi:hypothetical protein